VAGISAVEADATDRPFPVIVRSPEHAPSWNSHLTAGRNGLPDKIGLPHALCTVEGVSARHTRLERNDLSGALTWQ